MLFLIFFLVNSTFAHATQVDCQNYSTTLQLDTAVPFQCHEMKLSGVYQMKLCSDDRGLLTAEDGSLRHLFMVGAVWMARQDTLDFTNKIAITEILKIDLSQKNFTVSVVKTKSDGTILEDLNCSGMLK